MRHMVTGFLALALAAGVAQAQEKKGGMAALPTADDLKTKVAFDEEQIKKAEPILTEYSPKLKEAAEKAKTAEDKKAAFGEVRTIRTEAMAKLKEICKDDEQKKKLDEAFPARRKKE